MATYRDCRPFHNMPPNDPIVLFCNASKHSLLCQLFAPIVFKLKLKINGNSNIENVTESSKGNQLHNTFCIAHYLCNIIH